MTKCEICGKTLKNPKATSHINSKFHQNKLKQLKQIQKKDLKAEDISKININTELVNLKNIIYNLEKRVVKIENKLNSGGLSSKLIKSVATHEISKEINLEQEIINIVNQRSNLQQIKGNFILNDLKEIILNEYNISDKDFEDNILRLYRKQLVDLQPGGNPADYHLISPTGKKFYYLMIKS